LSIANDDSSSKSMALYQKFKAHVKESTSSEASEHWHNETVYL